MKTKKQFTNRILSLVLVFVMVAGMLPMTSFTAEAANISTSSSTIQKGHYIYFGSSGQKWRVLDASKTNMGTDGMFLLSENSLGTASSGPTARNYTTNGLAAWCTNYYNGTNFTTAEKNVMIATTVAQSTGTYGDHYGTNYALNGDYLFLLSAEEVTNSAYFADDDARKLNHSNDSNRWWFLRTDSSLGSAGLFFDVNRLGTVRATPIISDGENGTGMSYRPGFNLDTSKILFVTAATGGKTNGLAVVSASGSEWKLTLKDSNSFANGASISKTTFCAGQSVTVAHKALSAISADYTNITAAIFSGDMMLYYGSVNTNTSATSSTVTLPADLTAGSYTLKLYGEDWNGDNRTDIATGTPYSVNITVQNHTGGTATCVKKAVCSNCGNEYGTTTEHSYQYSASGNVITETCKNNCGYSETATLEAADATYTGSAITTGAFVTYSNGWAGSKEHGEIIYSNNLNAGDATAKVTVAGKELTTTFKINAANMNGAAITLNPASGTYDGNEQKPTVSVVWNNMPLAENTDYTLSWDKSGFTNADSYTVTVTGKGNFEGTVTKAFGITQKEIGFSWGGVNFLPYTGQLVLPEASATGLADGDTCEVIVSVVETTEGAGINPGQWTARITGLSNENYKLSENSSIPLEVKYTIYATQTAPNVSGVAETIKGKNDGYISGLTTEMEYATEPTNLNSAYTRITDPDMIFTPGTYYVRYAAKDYYYSSSYTEVTVAAGSMLTVTVPTTQMGYAVTATVTELEWNGSTTLTFALKDGYSQTSAFAVKINGNTVELNAENQYVITGAQENIEVTVEGVADTTPPTAEITLATNKWNTFLNNITFGLFFKETQSVTVSAEDVNTGSGLDKVCYYLANEELTENEVKALADWKEYDGAFNINPNNEYIIYAKVVDNAGNTTYISSDGIVLDAIVPVITGIENNGTYYGDTEFGVDESYIDTVTVDGNTVELTDGKYTITADGMEHIIVVTDKAGNSATVKITVTTIDPNAPVTGDNSHMMLWIALFFISGGAVITLTVVDRKRRTVSKR